MTYQSPFFIIGNPRSGTSLLRLMLTTHSKLIVPPECGFLVWWYHKFKNWNISDSTNEFRITEYLRDLQTSRKIETWNLNYNELRNLITTLKPGNYAELSALVYVSYSMRDEKNISLWGDKNNHYLNHLETLHTLYPDAYFIHLVRDGRDVACSYRALKNINTKSSYKPQLPYAIKEIAEEWKQNVEHTDLFLKQIPQNKKHLLKYEELIENPEKTITGVSQFLGIDYEPSMLSYYKSNTEPEAFIAWKQKTLLPPDPGNKNTYLMDLSASDISEFNQIAGNTLKLYGYTL